MHLTEKQLSDLARILAEVTKLDNECEFLSLDFDNVNLVGSGFKVYGHIAYRDSEWVFVPIAKKE